MARRAPRSIVAMLGAPFVVAAAARADVSVQQKITYAGDAPGTADFNWAINDREFRLDVKRGLETRSFVFNGRVFYVCGRLDKVRLEAMRKLNLSDKALLASLEKGVCQDLGTEFGLRFFLSPYDAVGNADAAAGFSTSLTVEGAEIGLAGTTGSAGKVKCVNFTRNYALADKKRSGQEQVDEAACNAPSIKWRSAFGRQLGMTLIRQPNGKQNYQTLSADLKKMPGLTVTASVKINSKGAGGKAINRSYAVATSSIKEGELKPSDFSFPAGFEALDPDAVALAAKADAPKRGAAAEQPDLIGVLRMLILGANPAAALLGGK